MKKKPALFLTVPLPEAYRYIYVYTYLYVIYTLIYIKCSGEIPVPECDLFEKLMAYYVQNVLFLPKVKSAF